MEGLVKLTTFCFALILGAVAAKADPYSNIKYGYSIDVPKEIAVGLEEADAGDGIRSHSADKQADFVAYAGFLFDENGQKVKFATEVKDRLKSEVGGGSKIKYKKIDPKGWAAYSGVDGDKMFYARVILACKGGAIASYRLQYPAVRKTEFVSIIKTLNASLIDNGGCKLKN